MIKKWLAFTLSFAILAAALPVSAYDNDKVLFSETFSGYAENDNQIESVKLVSGVDSRVIEEKGNKVLFSRAWGESVGFKVPVKATDAKQFVVSQKVKMSGEVVPAKLLTLMMNGVNVSFVNIDKDGKATLPDGKSIGGAPQQSYVMYTLLVDINKQSFDLYVNDKCVAYDHFFLDGASFAMPTEISVSTSFADEGETDLYLDDIRVYEGTKLPWNKAFAESKAVSDVLPFTPSTEIDTSSEILSTLKDTGSFAFSNAGGVFKNTTFEDGTSGVNYSSGKDEKTSSYINIGFNAFRTTDRYIIDSKVRVNKFTGGSKFTFLDRRSEEGAWDMGYNLLENGTIQSTSAGVAVGKYNKGEWVRLSIAYDILSGTATVYVNGEKTSSHAIKADFRPASFRCEFPSPAGAEIDVDIAYICFYTGRFLLEESEIAGNGGGGRDKSVMDPQDKLQQALAGKQVFMLTNDYMYYKSKKQEYPDESYKPILIGDIPYMPINMMSLIADKKVEFDSESGNITIDNNAKLKVGDKNYQTATTQGQLDAPPKVVDEKLYLPVIGTIENILLLNVVYDNRGAITVSKDEIPAVDKYHYTDRYIIWKPMDLIYRYMQFDNPTGDEIISEIKKNWPNKQHPRILFTYDDIDYMLDRIAVDSEWKKAYNAVIKDANRVLSVDMTPYYNANDGTKDASAKTMQDYLTKLSQAYLLTGDTKYAEKGVEILKGACSWDNMAYKPAGNLLIGHYCMGIAIGYDSFYNYMVATEQGRADMKYIRDAMRRMPYADHINAYTGVPNSPHWITMQDNFLGVVGGGLLSLLLSMADEEDMYDDSVYLLDNVLRSIEVATCLFAPNGGYYEGYTYAEYMNVHLPTAFNALINCCKTDYGVAHASGYIRSGYLPIYEQTPTARFNFHDGGETQSFHTTSTPEFMQWRFGLPYAAELSRLTKRAGNHGDDLKGLLYYEYALRKSGESDLSQAPLDQYFYGAEVGSFSNSKTVGNPTTAFIHGGLTNLPHDSLDLGIFVFESDNILWTQDLGNDSYSLPDYFGVGGYKVYRKRPEGENCIVLNPAVDTENYYGQALGAEAVLVDLDMNKTAGAKAVYDLTSAYSRDAEKYIRGYFFGDNRNNLTVQDEITLKPDTELYWFMNSAQKIEIVDNTKAILTAPNGKTCIVDIYCSSPDYTLSEMPCTPLQTSPKVSGQMSNNNYKKLAIHIPKATGNVTISVKLSPQNNGTAYYKPTVTPISEWKVPDDGQLTKTLSLSGIYVDGKPIEGFMPSRTVYAVDVPYTNPAPPVITATAPEGEVIVQQADSLAGTTVVQVRNPGMKDFDCNITFTLVPTTDKVNIVDALVDTEPFVGTTGKLIRPVSAILSDNSQGIASRAANMIDDNMNTSGVTTYDEWHEVDLGEVMDIQGVALAWVDSNIRKANFEILYSVDGVNYTRVFDGQSTGTSHDEYESIELPGKARYIRYQGHGNTASAYNNIIEFRAYK